MHEAAQVLVKGLAAVHDAAIVPDYEIADPPLLVPGEALLRGMGPDRVEQRLALINRQATDVRAGTTAKEECLAFGHGVKADEGMHGAWCMAYIDCGLEAFAQLTGGIAAG